MIVFITFLGLFLRLISLDQSLWLDEAITATIARDLSLNEIFKNYLPFDNHPPLYLLLIHFLLKILPATDFVVRAPSVLFGTLTILTIYFLAKELKSKKIALISSLLLATSPLHIYYSQEGRMYALNALLVSLLMFASIKFLKAEKNLFLYIFTLVGILIIYTDYLPAVVFIAVIVSLNLLKKFSKKWIFVFFAVGISYLPWLSIFVKQLNLGFAGRGRSELFDKVLGKFDPASLPLTFEKFVLGRIPIDFNVTLIVIVPVLFTFIFLLILGIKRADNFSKKILLTWAIIPIIFSQLLSLKLPVYLYFRMVFILPVFYLLLGLGIAGFKNRLFIFILSLVVLINLCAVSFYYFDEKIQRENWKQATKWINLNLQSEDVVLFTSGDPFPPYSWYKKDHPDSFGAFEGFYVQDSDEFKIEKLIEGKRRLFVFTYLQDITDPSRKLQEWLINKKYLKKSAKSFHGIGEIQIYEK